MKRATLMAALSGLASIGGACARAEDITLKFWDNQQTESGLSQYQKEAVQRFEKENPGIHVEVTTVPYPEYQQRLLTAVQGGNAPDVSTLDQIWIAAFAKAGAIIAARRPRQGGRHQGRHLLQGRLGVGQLRRQALGHPVQRRCLVLHLLQQRAAEGRRRRPGHARPPGTASRPRRRSSPTRARASTASACSPARARTRWWSSTASSSRTAARC